MLRRLWTKYDRDWGWNLARLLAYACLSALFAVVGLELAVLALVLRFASAATQQNIIKQIVRFLPDRVTGAAVSAFAHDLQHAPWWLIVLGIVVALWYGSRFFVVMESCLCIIFRRPKRTFLAQNRAALLMLLLFAVLLPIIVLAMTTLSYADIDAPATQTMSEAARLANDPLFASLSIAAGFLANVALLLIAYMELTPGRVALRHALPGAVLASVLAQGYLLIFPLYVRYILHPSHFGTVAGIFLVALVFFFAYAVFIMLGAELASVRAGYQPTTHDVTILLSDLHAANARMGEESGTYGVSAADGTREARRERGTETEVAARWPTSALDLPPVGDELLAGWPREHARDVFAGPTVPLGWPGGSLPLVDSTDGLR